MLLLVIALVLLTTILFQSCAKTWEEETILYLAPNWTSDGKIVFIEKYELRLVIKEWLFPRKSEIKEQKLWLWEYNSVGTGKNRISLLRSEESEVGYPSNTSSAEEWVTFSISDTREIYIINRDGTGLQKIGDGTFPDFSPDGQKIVYQKQDEGIWIMNRNGSEDHQIISDGQDPAWSPDGGRIAYIATSSTTITMDSLCIADTFGNIINSLGEMIISPDWSLSTIDTLMACLTHPQKILKISLSPIITDTLNIPGSLYVRWAPNGQQIISADNNGFYVSNVNGSGKWYLVP